MAPLTSGYTIEPIGDIIDFMNRQTFWTLLRFLITIGLLVFLFTRVGLTDVAAALWQADPIIVSLALLLYLCAILTNVLKWGALIAGTRRGSSVVSSDALHLRWAVL